ncbi:MAG: hypothetical protein H7222_09360 [Methylotenera sp.]|nr:hypothetical protein [Oligoflexia bacterium]
MRNPSWLVLRLSIACFLTPFLALQAFGQATGSSSGSSSATSMSPGGTDGAGLGSSATTGASSPDKKGDRKHRAPKNTRNPCIDDPKAAGCAGANVTQDKRRITGTNQTH